MFFLKKQVNSNYYKMFHPHFFVTPFTIDLVTIPDSVSQTGYIFITVS